jgi:hypothetical protein
MGAFMKGLVLAVVVSLTAVSCGGVLEETTSSTEPAASSTSAGDTTSTVPNWVPDSDRFCELFTSFGELDFSELSGDQAPVAINEARALLDEMVKVAPTELRGPVAIGTQSSHRAFDAFEAADFDLQAPGFLDTMAALESAAVDASGDAMKAWATTNCPDVGPEEHPRYVGFNVDPRAFLTADIDNMFSTMGACDVFNSSGPGTDPWNDGVFDFVKWAECPLGEEVSELMPDELTWEIIQRILAAAVEHAKLPIWDTACVALVAEMVEVLNESAPTALDAAAAHDLAVAFIDASAWFADRVDDTPFPNESTEVQWLANCSAINGSK